MFDASKLLNQMFGGGGQGIGGLLGGLLNDSVSGMKAGASAINRQTGIGAGVDGALRGATGQSAGDLINQVTNFANQNKLATGAALGGLGALLLGTGGGRNLIGTAATLGGLAMVGGLAYNAWQKHQAGEAPPTPGQPAQIDAPPAASPFGETGNLAQDNATSMLILRAMIAAAASDGVVDNEERSRIVGALQNAGLDVYAAKFLEAEFAKPATIAELAAAATTPALAAQTYTAARIAIEPDGQQEKDFLANLATALKLDPGLTAQIDAGASAAKH